MAKAGKNSLSPQWTEKLDRAEVQEAMDDAQIDCYGEYEQHTGLLTMIQNVLALPFNAQVLGDTVEIVAVEWPENDEFGLDLIVERNGQRHRIDARSVDLLPPFPKGHLYLAAYLDWRRGL